MGVCHKGCGAYYSGLWLPRPQGQFEGPFSSVNGSICSISIRLKVVVSKIDLEHTYIYDTFQVTTSTKSSLPQFSHQHKTHLPSLPPFTLTPINIATIPHTKASLTQTSPQPYSHLNPHQRQPSILNPILTKSNITLKPSRPLRNRIGIIPSRIPSLNPYTHPPSAHRRQNKLQNLPSTLML